MKFKRTVVLSAMLGMSFTALAQEDATEDKTPLKAITTIGSGEMFQHIDLDKVASDLSRRQELQIEQDMLSNETAATIARMESLHNLSEEETLRYIRENVPMQVRVLGKEQSMAWLQAQYEKEVDGLGREVVWQSSSNNVFVPDVDTQAHVSSQPKNGIQALSEAELEKLRALNNPTVDAESKPQPSPKNTTKAEPVENSKTDRRFVTPQTVTVDTVMILGSKKSFTGDIAFKVNLKNGEDNVSSRFKNLKVGDQFTVQGKRFVLGEISNAKLTIIDMESSESHFLKY